MDKLIRVFAVFVFLILSACGSENNQSSSSSVSSFANSSLSNSSSRGTQSVHPKILEVKFADNGCLESSNADAVTDFDIADSSRRMLSWGCVIGDLPIPSNLNLFYNFDTTLGCYKKIFDDETLIKGALYSKTYFPDCSLEAETVLQPRYALELVELTIIPDTRLVDPKFGFSVSYELKNTGTLPVTQYKIDWRKSKYPSGSQLGSFGTYYSASQLMPGESITSLPISFHSPEYYPGDLIDFTFVVTDYFGNELVSTVKRVVVE